jgi:hypothetical protein
VCLVQDFKSRIGADDGVKRVCGGRINDAEEDGVIELNVVSWSGLVLPENDGVEGVDLRELLYSMISNMFSGCLLVVMIVVTPAPVAISAAMSFVSIPPVPRLDPNVVVLTVEGCELLKNQIKDEAFIKLTLLSDSIDRWDDLDRFSRRVFARIWRV